MRTKILSEDLQERHHLGKRGIDWRIILKYILIILCLRYELDSSSSRWVPVNTLR
jgi:hypothetical protein